MSVDPEVGSLEELLGNRGRRLRRLVLAASLGCSLGLAAFALIRELPPRPSGLAGDYRVFYAAAEVISRGGNPYSLSQLHLAENWGQALAGFNAVINTFVDPPATAWVLVPLSKLAFWLSYGVLTGLGVLVVAVTITLLARDLGWRHTSILAAAVLVSWIGLLGLLSGQLDALLFAALAGSMLLAWHERSLAAGCVLALTLLKPTVLWPVPVFMFLALWPDRRRAVRFAAGFLLIGALFVLASWSHLSTWWHSVGVFASGVGNRQPDLAGLPGLLGAAPRSWGLGTGITAPTTLLLVAVAVAAMASFATWMMISPDWRRVSLVGRVTWAAALPMGIWLLAIPYAHPNDDLLLLPLFMLTVGRDARRVHGLGLGLSAAATVLFLLIWPAGVVPWQLGVVVFAALGIGLWRWRTDVRLTGFGAGLCVMALAALPPLWAFHALAVGLTPVAVLFLVIEGGRTCWMEVGGAGTGPAYFAEPMTPGIANQLSGA
ncbi:MAG: glycosyltransferase family 87 protein [Candidatus Dormiibacterota bacterium]